MARLSTAAVPVGRLLLCGVAALAAVFACGWSLLLAYSDSQFRRGDPAGVHAAVQATPLDADYLAEWSLVTRDPMESHRALERAVRANPTYAWGWIQLGLAAESAGDYEMAGRDLLRAAQLDRGFDPRWALCNFYFRRKDDPQFWYWARQALSIDVAELTPVFRLAWKMDPNAAHILSRALPPGNVARDKFLSFLIREEARESDFSTILTLLPDAGREETTSLVSYANLLLSEGNTPAAVTFWNGLCRLGFVPFHLISPKNGANLLTNADFSIAPSGKVFDWSLFSAPGLSTEAETASQELSLKLSGEQPENCRVLAQQVPVPPGRRYALTWQVHVSPAVPRTGLRWRIFGRTDPAKVLAESTDLAPDSQDEGYFAFRTAGESLLTVALDYSLPHGTARTTGLVTVRELNLRATDAPRSP